jgi:DNA-binding transcriptional ArsR family regulator
MPATKQRPRTRLTVPRAAHLFRLLSDPTRVVLLLELDRAGEEDVSDLAAAGGRSPTLTSHHLCLLRDAGVVKFRQEGKRHLYRLAPGLARYILGLVR